MTGGPGSDRECLGDVQARDVVTGRRGLAARSASHHSSEMWGPALGGPGAGSPLGPSRTHQRGSNGGARQSAWFSQIASAGSSKTEARGVCGGLPFSAPFRGCPYPGSPMENRLVRGLDQSGFRTTSYSPTEPTTCSPSLRWCPATIRKWFGLDATASHSASRTSTLPRQNSAAHSHRNGTCVQSLTWFLTVSCKLSFPWRKSFWFCSRRVSLALMPWERALGARSRNDHKVRKAAA